MRVLPILLLSFFLSSCGKTDIQRCVDAYMNEYDTLKKENPKRFEEKFCTEKGCTTRVETLAFHSDRCLYLGTQKK